MRTRDMYIQQAIDILQEHYFTIGGSDAGYDETRLQWAIETALEVMRDKVEEE